MSFTIAVPVETKDNDTRVALAPDDVAQLRASLPNATVLIQRGAGVQSEFADASYERSGGKIVGDRHEMFETADLVARVKRSQATVEATDLVAARPDSMWIGFLDPQIADRSHLTQYAARGIAGLTFEMLPQTPELAQFDATAAMSRVSAQVVLDEAKERLGSLQGKRVLVLGVGNAGLEAARVAGGVGAEVTAISTSDRHKALLNSWTTRFVQIPDERTWQDTATGFLIQRDRVAEILASGNFDVVICGARRVRQPAPQLISDGALRALEKPTLFYDLTASSGGNCQGTVYGKEVQVGNALLLSKTGYPKSRPHLASTHYSSSLAALARNLFAEENEAAFAGAVQMVVAVQSMVNPRLVQGELTEQTFDGAARDFLGAFRARAQR